MKTTVITIGNSKGVRIPKVMLEESGLGKNVELEVKKGEIKITPAKPATSSDTFAALSEKSFAKDWLRPEEESAWAAYQPGK